jgi:N-acetylmuramoyl-L-alanine amidase
MRRNSLQRLQRIFLVILLVAVLGIVLIGGRIAGYGLPSLDGTPSQGFVSALFNKQIALISGHAGYDSGAVCEDEAGNVSLREVDVNAEVAELTARRLRRAGADVMILDEFDPRLEGLQADVLISLHADSCIDASGFKAAHHVASPIIEEETRLLACIDQHYASATGLVQHPNTVTHDMTRYHAFNRIDPQTPAAILEMGFLGQDRPLLEERPQFVAQGVADSVICFLSGER